MTTKDISKRTIAEQATQPLSQLLGLKILHLQAEDQVGGSSGTVSRVAIWAEGQNEHHFILKKQDNDGAYRFYQQYLARYQLNSPKTYGYIELEGQRLLVMEYVKHWPPNWDDGNGYLKAVAWLVKKDLVTGQNWAAVSNLDCFGQMEFYGVPYWLSQFEQWGKDSPSNQQAQAVWRRVSAHQNRINAYIDELKEIGVQTVVHGDLQMSNVLFGEDDAGNETFVIDWTQPHLGSVSKDLASLYDNAPDPVKNEVISTYRQQIDFPHFDEIFAKAKVLRDIGYLAWMVWMINEGQKEEIAQSEVERVANSLILSLA